MSTPHEELKAQRELIKKHLEWLDRQIERTAPLEDQKVSVTETDKVDTASQVSHSQAANKAASISVDEKVSAPLDEKNDFEDFSNFPKASGRDLVTAKVGCIGLFILAAALVLFLLFGLPYLLPEPDTSTTEEVITEES